MLNKENLVVIDDSDDDFVGIACSLCTFLNTKNLLVCEMCANNLSQSSETLKVSTLKSACCSCYFQKKSSVCNCKNNINEPEVSFMLQHTYGFDLFKKLVHDEDDCDLIMLVNNIDSSKDKNGFDLLDLKSPKSCSSGIIELLNDALSAQSNTLYFLCSPFPHITQLGEEGSDWSCGYRNIQMLCLSLMQRPDFYPKIFDGNGTIPDILGIQRWIERAWEAGFDSEVRDIQTQSLFFC